MIAKSEKKEYDKTYNHCIKRRVLSHYSKGQPRCACCGEDQIVFLTLDHKDGRGAKHRKKLFGKGTGGGATIYRWAVKNGYPPLFRVLCFNCNFAIHVLGECPHVT